MTLYVVQARGDDDASMAKARFVKDGFSWPAFVLAQVWLLYHRLWLVLAIWIALEIAFFVFVFPHVSGGAFLLIDGLAHLFIGFEGNRLRLAKGARRATLTDLVEARDREDAEAIFFRRRAPGSGPA